MNRCSEAAAVAATVPGSGVGAAEHRPPMVPRQASFIPPPVPNPFVQHTGLGTARLLQAFLLGIILLPLRLILIGLLFLLSWPFAAAFIACCPEKPTYPVTDWRRTVTHLVLRYLGYALYFSMGFKVSVKGKPASALEAPIFVVAPHSSFFDGIACIVSGLPSLVSRYETVQIPMIGRYCDLDMARIYIHPALCADFLPALHKGGNRAKTIPSNRCGSARELYPFVPHKCQRSNYITTEFMPVQVPSDAEKNDPVLFANRVRNLMAEALGIPVTDHTYEDCRLMISAGQLTLPMEAGLVEFTKISQKLKLDWDGIRKHLDEYASIARSSKGGRIGIEEFAEYLKLPVSDVLRQLFALFDRNRDGTIDFREYVIGLAVLCHPANTEEIIQVAFKLFDIDEDGYITKEEFSTILQASLGLPNLDVSGLFKEISQGDSVSYEEFKLFALRHPEYAKIFTTYLDLQTSHVYSLPREVHTAASVASNKVCPEDHEDRTSDKKDD
ncbi:lysophosphatidylcholine acyltransferase 2 isoform X3 [Ictidomys tridecemlineatus]|uniref:lysophosphatidylcholine acyltransferase 2 isoform X5 n=1 Tax=Ictidomys tridecemlineatus TaxID=43179 RepID=UPI000B53AE34|nr:lysophosphatidylcholine acyltransferase 2 isoform X5 [Ictidomys tridecemlineatus]KAG3257268.1 lysophosphatidylcholine acyltransferase 2, transcript variant X3 [Ictidomys tridecemlineatus]